MLGTAEKALEDEGQVLGWDAHTIVADADLAAALMPLSRDGGAQPWLGVLFERVLDEVGEDLIPLKREVCGSRSLRLRWANASSSVAGSAIARACPGSSDQPGNMVPSTLLAKRNRSSSSSPMMPCWE